jgi:HEAT repeat protein
LIALVVFGALVIGCGDGGDAYRVATDLGPAIRALGSDDLEESEFALARIRALDADALPALERALAREPAPVRRGVVEVLEQVQDARATTMLTRAAADADVEVRAAALTALGQRGDPAGRAPVEAALADAEPRVALAAVGACPALCESTPALRRLVAIAVGGEPLPTAAAARTALAHILAADDASRAQRGRQAIHDAVPAALGSPDAHHGALLAALLASDVGDPAGRGVLARAVGGDAPPLLRLQAIHALGSVGMADDVSVLAALDGQPTFGEYAYDALERLRERGVGEAREALAGWRGPRPAAALPPPPGAR